MANCAALFEAWLIHQTELPATGFGQYLQVVPTAPLVPGWVIDNFCRKAQLQNPHCRFLTPMPAAFVPSR